MERTANIGLAVTGLFDGLDGTLLASHLIELHHEVPTNKPNRSDHKGIVTFFGLIDVGFFIFLFSLLALFIHYFLELFGAFIAFEVLLGEVVEGTVANKGEFS